MVTFFRMMSSLQQHNIALGRARSSATLRISYFAQLLPPPLPTSIPSSCHISFSFRHHLSSPPSLPYIQYTSYITPYTQPLPFTSLPPVIPSSHCFLASSLPSLPLSKPSFTPFSSLSPPVQSSLLLFGTGQIGAQNWPEN